MAPCQFAVPLGAGNIELGQDLHILFMPAALKWAEVIRWCGFDKQLQQIIRESGQEVLHAPPEDIRAPRRWMRWPVDPVLARGSATQQLGREVMGCGRLITGGPG